MAIFSNQWEAFKVSGVGKGRVLEGRAVVGTQTHGRLQIGGSAAALLSATEGNSFDANCT